MNCYLFFPMFCPGRSLFQTTGCHKGTKGLPATFLCWRGVTETNKNGEWNERTKKASIPSRKINCQNPLCIEYIMIWLWKGVNVFPHLHCSHVIVREGLQQTQLFRYTALLTAAGSALGDKNDLWPPLAHLKSSKACPGMSQPLGVAEPGSSTCSTLIPLSSTFFKWIF